MGQSLVRRTLAVLACAVACLLPQSVPAATLVRTQPPCSATGGPCIDFTGATTTAVLARSFAFDAPGRGAAQVFFNGSLFCVATSQGGANLTLEGQIVTSLSAAASAAGAGGQYYSITFEASGRSDTFNMSATRVFAIPAAGRQNYYFKLTKTLMHDGARCWVYGAAFSVIFAN